MILKLILSYIVISLVIGILYLSTGSLLIAMITHALERWIVYKIRKDRWIRAYE